MLRARALATALGAGAALVAFGPARFAVAEASMLPTLEPGDFVLARRRRGVPRRGAVVVTRGPRHLIKRVVGIPGDRIDVAGGTVRIDGDPGRDPWAAGPTDPDGSWDVPPGMVYLLGDNRPASAGDGRSTGPVPVEEVGWIVTAVYWPPIRAGRPGR